MVGAHDQTHRHLDGQLTKHVRHNASVREHNDRPIDEHPHGEILTITTTDLRRFSHEAPRLAYGEEDVSDAAYDYPDVTERSQHVQLPSEYGSVWVDGARIHELERHDHSAADETH